MQCLFLFPARVQRQIRYFVKTFFINISKTNVISYMNIILLNISMLNLNVLIREQNAVQDMFCKFSQ